MLSKTEKAHLAYLDERQAVAEARRADSGFKQAKINPKERRRHFMAFLREIPKGRVFGRYEIEGATRLFGENLDAELDAAEEAGVIHCEGTGWRKVDYFSY